MLHYGDYVNSHVDIQENTRGGNTYIVDGKKLCFAYTKSHYKAVEALSIPGNKDISKVDPDVVEDKENRGEIELECPDLPAGTRLEHPFAGCKVYDSSGELIGELDSRCSHPAGFGTDHVGTGRCKYHGGMAGRKPVHGRHSRAAEDIRAKVDAYLEEGIPQLLDLSRELTTQRLLLDRMLEYFQNNDDEEKFVYAIPQLMKSVDIIGRMVERIVKIENSTALTASQVLYLQVTVADIVTKYIQDPMVREKAAAEIASRLAGSSPVPAQIQASTLASRVAR